jgi:hypothetical protein
MPVIRGRTEYWWNWSVRDRRTGKLKTLFTRSLTVVTREQLRAHVMNAFPNYDYADFSCELTDKLPQQRRDLVPMEARADDWQLWANRRLTGERHDAGQFIKPGLIEPKVVTPKRIL